jgi:hypothetical protein
LKVYATCVQAEFDAFFDNSSLRPRSRYEGVIGTHPRLSAISEFIDKFLNGTEAAREDMQEVIDEADALAILVEGNAVKDMYFMTSDDVEDKIGYGEEEVDQTRWPCRAECVIEEKPEVVSATSLAAHCSTTKEQIAERRALGFRIGDESAMSDIGEQHKARTPEDLFSPGTSREGGPKRRKTEGF